MNRFADCVKAVNKAHDNDVVHRDIKPQNIFLNKQGQDGGVQAKLGDFGIAVKCGKNSKVTTPIGTPLYLDPQRMAGRAYGQKADMWSLGCVLYEMAALKPAFNARSMQELKSKVAGGKVNMNAIPDHYDPKVKSMIADMLQVQESARPSIQHIMKGQLVGDAVRKRSSSCPPAVRTPADADARIRKAPADLRQAVASERRESIKSAASRARAPHAPSAVASRRRERSQSPATRVQGSAQIRGREGRQASAAGPRPPSGARSRSRSPVVDAAERIRSVRGRSSSVPPGATNARGRSASPSQGRRASRANIANAAGNVAGRGPSPLGGGGNIIQKKVEVKIGRGRERQMTPEADDVSNAIQGKKAAPNQASIVMPRRSLMNQVSGIQQNPWVLPPIQKARGASAAVGGRQGSANPWNRR